MKVKNWHRNEHFGSHNQELQNGTCNVLFFVNKHAVQIIAVVNEAPGNGDFARTMDRFERMAKRRKKPIRVLEIWNENLKTHLIEKRNYTDKGEFVEKG